MVPGFDINVTVTLTPFTVTSTGKGIGSVFFIVSHTCELSTDGGSFLEFRYAIRASNRAPVSN